MTRRSLPRAAFVLAAVLLAAAAPAGESGGVTLAGAGKADGPLGLLGQDLQVDGGILDFVKEKGAVVIRNYAVLAMGPVRIRARNMVFRYETREVFAEGDVTFEQVGGSSFECDRMLFDTGNWRGFGDNIRIKAARPEGSLPVVDFLDEGAAAPTARRDSGVSGMGAVSRMVVAAREVRAIDKTHQELIGGSVTPSLFAVPHWSIQAAAINLRQGEKVESWHNVLKIGRVPVFYFPYLLKDLKYDWPWLRVGGGSSSDWGAYVLTKVGFDIDPKPTETLRLEKMFFDIDWRSERGWATGWETLYQTGKGRSFGKLDLYYLKETEITQGDDRDRAWQENDTSYFATEPNFDPDLYRDEERWGLDWWHRQELTERWDVRMEAHKYSDRDYRREYFEKQYQEDKEPETAIDLRYLHENWEFELFANKRLNGWENQSEYLPEARITVPGFRLGDLPVYAISETRVGWINRRFDEAFDKYGYLEGQKLHPGETYPGELVDSEIRRIKSGDDYGTFFRAHEDLRLEAPIHLGDFVLTPYIGERLTWYEKQYGNWQPDSALSTYSFGERRAGRYDTGQVDGDTGNGFNSAFLWGADLSTRRYGLLDNGNWRHVIEPTIGFTGGEEPTLDADHLYTVDEIDAYDERHFFTFGLHNKFQTHRNGALVDVLDVGLKLRWFPLAEEQQQYNFGRETTELQTDITWRPTDRLTLWGSGLLDTEDQEFNRLYVGGDWRFADRFRLYAQHGFYRGHYYRYPKLDASSTTTLALRTRLWDKDSKYAIEVSMNYDWEDNPSSWDGFAEKRITLYRDLDTFELGLSFVSDKAEGDKGVFVTLTPKGWANIDREATNTASQVPLEEPSRYGDVRAAEEEESRPADEDAQDALPPLSAAEPAEKGR